MTTDKPFEETGEHLCAAWGCSRVIKELEFMCSIHWPQVSDQAKHAIFQAYAPKQVKRMAVGLVREKEATKIVV
jgi:hypothetical protein